MSGVRREHRSGVLRVALTLALPLALALACAPPGVVPEGALGSADSGRFVIARGKDAVLVVTGRRWSVPPQQLLVTYTPLWVELANHGRTPLRVGPENFVLLRGKKRIAAVRPESVVESGAPGSDTEARVVQAEGFHPSTLDPGETERGYLFFLTKLPRSSRGEPVSLEATLFDPSGKHVVERLEAHLVAR